MEQVREFAVVSLLEASIGGWALCCCDGRCRQVINNLDQMVNGFRGFQNLCGERISKHEVCEKRKLITVPHNKCASNSRENVLI